jgi:hypothetical protein
LVKKAQSKTKAKAKQAQVPKVQKIDKNDHMSYQIGSVIRDKKGRITHARIGDNLYAVPTLHELYGLGYGFYTSDDGIWKRDVLLINKKSGKYYFATQADTRKENNLDYLPLARLD